MNLLRNLKKSVQLQLFKIKDIQAATEYEKYQKLVKCIIEEDSPYAIIGTGVRKRKLAELLINYFLFKSLVRNPLNHASKKKLDMKKIKADMVWKDVDAIFIKNGNPVRDVTVDVLTKMIHELLEQIGMIR